MTTILIIALLGGAAYFGYVIYKNEIAKIGNQSQDSSMSNELKIENIQAGGVLSLKHIGPDLKNFDVSVLSRHIYSQGSYKWYELEGESGDEKVWITFERDDELDISVVVKKLRLEQIGLTPTDLDKIDDNESGQFVYDGTTFYYDDSDDARFHRNGDLSESEDFYYWSFEDENEDYNITIEDWGGRKEVFYSTYVKESQIEVFSLRSENS